MGTKYEYKNKFHTSVGCLLDLFRVLTTKFEEAMMKENRRETINCFGHKLMIEIFENYIPVDVIFPRTERFLGTGHTTYYHSENKYRAE